MQSTQGGRKTVYEDTHGRLCFFKEGVIFALKVNAQMFMLQLFQSKGFFLSHCKGKHWYLRQILVFKFLPAFVVSFFDTARKKSLFSLRGAHYFGEVKKLLLHFFSFCSKVDCASAARNVETI